MRARLWALAALVVLCASGAFADEVLWLKDGRKIPVARLMRRNGEVVFQTTKGEVFSVPEGQVLSPPLDRIATTVLVLDDGRRLPVLRLARRGGQVLFQTVSGERFSVDESKVLEPPLASIPVLDAPAAAPRPEPTPVPTPTPEPEPPAPPMRPMLPPLPIVEGEFVPLPDRWTIPFPETPRGARSGLLDPYDSNVLKGDRPIVGESTFLVLTGVLDARSEARRTPVASGVSTKLPEGAGFFGRGDSLFTTPRALVSLELFSGQTAFKPKTWALKATGAFNLNYVRFRENNNVDVDVRESTQRTREDAALEEAFGEVRLKTLSAHYDAVSLRAGIQPFVSDFRGFVFADTNLGARLFGNAANNRWQYNAAYFDLLEKQTNSELNTFDSRDQKVVIANLYRQDFLAHGHTLALSYHRSQDEADAEQHYDANGFLVRPAKIGSPRLHRLTTNYAGLASDGHLGRLNVSQAYYYAWGRDDDNPLAGRALDVQAFMGALEASLDRDWLRLKVAGFFASGDKDPLDDEGQGFDGIYDAPNFAGGAFSFWNRTAIGLTQTGVLLKGPDSLLPNLRSNKFEGQASFVNPGLMLANLELQAELTPKLRAVLNANYLRFHQTAALETLLFQPHIRRTIGIDLGAGVVYRPLLSENVVISAGVTGLLAGAGFEDLYSSTCAQAGCGSASQNLYNGFVQVRLAY